MNTNGILKEYYGNVSWNVSEMQVYAIWKANEIQAALVVKKLFKFLQIA